MPRQNRPRGDVRDALYGSERWRKARAAAIAAAGARCEACGSEHGLTVHHAVPVARLAAEGLDLCDPATLIVLCRRCHGGADGGRASRPRARQEAQRNPFMRTVMKNRRSEA